MPSSQQEKNFLAMAGEFLVAAELNRRQVLSAVTYGASKSADVWAFDDAANRAVRVEVKTTGSQRWVVGKRAVVRERWDPDVFWVLVRLPSPHPPTAETSDEQRGQHSPRFFVLTGEEIGRLTCDAEDRYRAKYQERNSRDFEGNGVPNLSLRDVCQFENAWDKLKTRVRRRIDGQ